MRLCPKLTKSKKPLIHEGFSYKIDRVFEERTFLEDSQLTKQINHKTLIITNAESKVVIKSTGEHCHDNSGRTL